MNPRELSAGTGWCEAQGQIALAIMMPKDTTCQRGNANRLSVTVTIRGRAFDLGSRIDF